MSILEDHLHSRPGTPTPQTHHCWIHSLPDEIISDILVTIVNLRLDAGFGLLYLGVDSQRRFEFPILAQLVCQRWNDIARQTPALWTFLNIEIGSGRNLQRRIRRAGVLPLEVRLSITGNFGSLLGSSQERRQVQEVDFVVRRYAHRIWKLVISGMYPTGTHELVKSLPRRFSNLRVLSVDTITIFEEISRHGLDLIAPQLRSLAVDSYFPRWSQMPMAANLEDLHVVEVRPASVQLEEFSAGLRAYPNIRKLVLHNLHIEGLGDSQTGDSLNPVFLGQLESLSLGEFSTNMLGWVFSLLVTPQLKTLELKERSSISGNTAELPTLHLSNLERLVLNIKFESTLKTGVDIIKQAPSLKHLAFMYENEVPAESPEWVSTAFGTLSRHWGALAQPLVLETLKTRGVHLSCILSILEGDGGRVVPSLGKVHVHYTDTFVSSSQALFAVHKDERRRLSGVVDLEIYGLWAMAMQARERVRCWEEEAIWFDNHIYY